MEDTLNTNELEKVSMEINAGEWKRLARHLGLKEYEIESLEHDNLLHGVRECCHRMLLQWKRSSKEVATKSQLIEALVAMNRNDVALKLQAEDATLPGRTVNKESTHHHTQTTSYVASMQSNIPQDSELERISKDLKPEEWKHLGRCLGLNESTLSQIECDNSFLGTSESCFQMLVKWKQMFGSEGTREKLLDALCDINRPEIVERLSSDLHESRKSHHLQSSSDTTVCPITQIELQSISNGLSDFEWTAVGKFLGLSETVLDQIKYEHHLMGSSECAFQMFLKWTQMDASRASKELLAEALVNIERIDLVEKLFPST